MARVARDQPEKQDADHPGDERHSENGAEVVTGGEQGEGDRGTDQRARGVEGLVETKGLAQVCLPDRGREHRRADGLPHASAHPRKCARHQDLRPGAGRDQ